MSEEPRKTMNGKPVIEVPAKAVINFKSGFGHKLLCDDLTWTAGSACAYSCAFCYVPSMMAKSPHMAAARVATGNPDLRLEDVVIRRHGALEAIRQQLIAIERGRGKKAKLLLPRATPLVIYASPLDDVAANLDVVNETVSICIEILERTPWDIRLLSKSNLLPRVAMGIPVSYRKRVVYGVSTGTLDDKLAKSFEQGTPKVSKRIEALHWLQDNGFRTFGMICPSLPYASARDYHRFAETMYYEICAHKCEHVWAEVLNVRGDSMVRTINGLLEGGFESLANELAIVSRDKAKWEIYARATFEAHAPLYAPGQLRYLQYRTKSNVSYWTSNIARGAVLLGRPPVAEGGADETEEI